jgi:thymidylate synthase
MRVIQSLNINDAWAKAKQVMLNEGIQRDSRNGGVLEHQNPVTTVYCAPNQRVLFDPIRDANPFFHLMEGLWMLAGRNDVAWITQFNSKFAQYSDDGKTFHAAYGYRWRHHFNNDTDNDDFDSTDQLQKVIAILKADPESRRAVVAMWDPRADLWSPDEIKLRGSVPKDLPCNTNIYFKIRDSKLLMTVTNRSNDIVWGCYGANVVHMSMLHEYMAAMIGVQQGSYWQVSDSWHAYLDTWTKQDLSHKQIVDPYRTVYAYPMVTHPEHFDDDLARFMDGPSLDEANYMNPFFVQVAVPMRSAWFCYKEKDFKTAFFHINRMPDNVDWRVAGWEWLNRRVK